VRSGRAALFLLSKMSQDAIEGLPRFIGYNVLVLNTGDDLYRSTAMTADLDIDIEDSLESLGPGHRSVILDS
jgi:hypothetical protein